VALKHRRSFIDYCIHLYLIANGSGVIVIGISIYGMASNIAYDLLRMVILIIGFCLKVRCSTFLKISNVTY